jgi:flagellar hook-length control protein FliK
VAAAAPVTASAAVSGNVAASSASALAATVTALHQSGQSGAVLRLDPPGLGNLSVHVGVGQQGQVNVLFVPDSSAGAQALQAGLNGLSQSMAQSGLTLGQAQVGGQFGQSAGQGGQGGQNAQNWRGTSTSTLQSSPTETVSRDSGGVSAYA